MEAIESVEKLLKEGRTVQFHPIGGSMFPLFKNASDYAIVEPMNGRSPRRGDVLVYRNLHGLLVIHRVYRATEKELYMLGDRQVEIEGPLPTNRALGVMSAYIRNGKRHGIGFVPYQIYSHLWMTLRTKRHFLFQAGHVLKVFLYKLRGKEVPTNDTE